MVAITDGIIGGYKKMARWDDVVVFKGEEEEDELGDAV